VPDPADVLWNTVGGAIGVVLITVPRLIGAAVQRARRRSLALDETDARVSAGV
jgi:hypothetical protein